MGGGGNRTTAVFSTNSANRAPGGADPGALVFHDCDLAAIVAVWPVLPSPIKAAVLALVRSGMP